MPRNNTDNRLIEPSQKPGNRDRGSTPHRSITRKRRPNTTGVPFGPRGADRDHQEAYRPPKVELKILKQHHSLPLYCHLCHRHLDDVAYAEKHIQVGVHLIKKAVSDLWMGVKNLPYPVDPPCDVISNFVKQIAKEHGLTRVKVELRRIIAEDLEAYITATLPDVVVTLHGSWVNDFGLKTSMVDMDLSPVGKVDAVELFIETSDLLRQCPKYSNVEKDFLSKISLNNCNSLKTSRLLDDYASLDPRVQTLGVALWFRAKILLPVLHEVKVCDESDSYVKPEGLEGRWACKNYRSMGQLWVELLCFYAVEFKLNKHVVCISKSQTVLIAEKWNKRYIAIEDPYSSKWNLARSIPSERVYLFVKGCLRSSAVYFLLPQFRSGCRVLLITRTTQKEDKLKGKKERQSQPPELSVVTKANNGYDDEEERGDGTKENDDDKYLSFDENVNVVRNRHLVPDSATKAKGHKTTMPPPPQQFVKPGPPIPQRILDDLDLCSVGDFHYSFPRGTLVCEKVSPLVCSFCHKSGQLREDCPDQRFPELKKLPNITRGLTKILNDVCQDVKNACALQPQEEAELDEVIAITNAKVSIVKLFHVPIGLEAYLSVYNTLAQQNTRLLQTYSTIDNRVRKLGYTAKRFAKTCDICDASRGSPPSYAYILMTLYYLQPRKPPVTPVLQELYPEWETKPEDIDHLQGVWREFDHNKESVEELWLVRLRFYTDEFNFKKHVVCIRQKATLTKLQKIGPTSEGVTGAARLATTSMSARKIGHRVKACPRQLAPGTSECDDTHTPCRQRDNGQC
ncbi:hypothetical protein HPB48_001212 [Haemaphysalis longicornis]|uniref:C2H2-type domain-containing protein n=1 Tax=Haemaphysalis longicornis TaxID=44386 RepID=A0A9J6FIB9_HAELO|nr:hypothetical protein HPB48_001212 [Haemaphysalis longicornis]